MSRAVCSLQELIRHARGRHRTFSQGDERDRCPHRCKLPRTSERHVEVFPKDHHEKGLRQSLTIFHALLVLFVQDRGSCIQDRRFF